MLQQYNFLEEPIHYFAYGSNLHPIRLGLRLNNIRFITTYKLTEYRLKFNKHGQDDTAKCNIEFTGLSSDYVHGVIYGIDLLSLKTLDKIEDLNAGYQHKMFRLPINGIACDVLTYVAMPAYVNNELFPFNWYKQLVLEGMRYHGFEKEYISAVTKLRSIQDSNQERVNSVHTILRQM